MPEIKLVREVDSLAEVVNLLRRWLKEAPDSSHMHSPQHECYEAVIHESSPDECGHSISGLCVHGLWKCQDRLGFCPGNDNQHWWMRSQDGGIELNAGATFLKWAGYHGFIVDEDLATAAAVWESKNSWWKKPGSRCICSLCV